MVTGASSGIGQRTARLLAAHGYRVFGTSCRERASEHGVEMFRLSVGSEESVARCVDAVHGQLGHLDVLVNNAGIMCEGFAEETTLDNYAPRVGWIQPEAQPRSR